MLATHNSLRYMTYDQWKHINKSKSNNHRNTEDLLSIKALPPDTGYWRTLCDRSGGAYSSWIRIAEAAGFSQLYQRREPKRSLDVCAEDHGAQAGGTRPAASGGGRLADSARTTGGRRVPSSEVPCINALGNSTL